MDPNLLTQKMQEALHDAQTRALRDGHTEIDVEHVLLALLTQPDGLVPRLLERGGAARPRVSGAGGQARTSRALAQVLDAAEGEMRRLKDEYVSVEHFLL